MNTNLAYQGETKNQHFIVNDSKDFSLFGGRKFSAFYQPILSIEDVSLFGHEVLAREEIQNHWVLPLEFQFKDIKIELFKNYIESLVLQSALNKYSRLGEGKLFINLSPDRLLWEMEQDGQDGFFSFFKFVANYNIDPKNLYIEITENASHRSIDAIATAVEICKQMGYKIAMDDVGTESSNLERIGAFHPDIIKIDLNLLKKSRESNRYKAILEYLKDLSLGIGAELLFEGVETPEELNLAMDYSAKYLQGFLFSKAVETMQDKKTFKEILPYYLKSFHETKRKSIMKEIDFEEGIRKSLSRTSITPKIIKNVTHLDVQSLFFASEKVLRVYATDWNGNQISPYYERSKVFSFTQDIKSLDKNWSYMSYFYKHIKLSFRNSNEWNTLEPYFDSKVDERVLVFSKILNENTIVFVDVIFNS
jgi:EAL domain-containing protein (putative c-di-GMP-specific phosphodiesterase class I)